ncbi:MAG: P-II family nitrogen regulator [Spirochaetales bacterium]|nr:P-II family nitrogen regulator [Spirochaetales bacterium]
MFSHGRYSPRRPSARRRHLRGREYEIKFVPKIKIVVADDKAAVIVDAVSAIARTGQVGDG